MARDTTYIQKTKADVTRSRGPTGRDGLTQCPQPTRMRGNEDEEETGRGERGGGERIKGKEEKITTTDEMKRQQESRETEANIRKRLGISMFRKSTPIPTRRMLRDVM